MAFLIGRKVKMEQQWDENGKVVPVTIVEAGPVVVTQVKTKDKDGYEAFQVGYDSSVKKVAKAQAGHLKQLGKFRFMREFKKAGDMNFAVGDTLDVSAFEKGDKVKVTGQDKGRGFQGVVKRHGFHGGPKTHGQKNRLRAPGSLGATAPQRVLKGRKMAGRMGNETVTLRKLPIVQVDKEKNLLYIKGPVPGTKMGILLIEKM